MALTTENQMDKPTQKIAKLIAPKISGVLHRNRLFVRLDKCRQHPVVWVSGSGGAGKTTLIASYLAGKNIPCLWYQVDEGDSDPATFFYFLKLAVKRMAQKKRTRLPEFSLEHLADIGPITRLFFRKLFDLLPQPLIIVLDNYHTVPEDALLHEIVAFAAGEVPANCSLMLISRHQPPSVFASLQINGQLSIIHADELRLNSDEARSLANLRIDQSIVDSNIDHWQQLTQGWTAGLVLLIESARTGGSLTAVRPAGEDIKEITFNYFGREIFRHRRREIQKFMVTSAYLPIMTIADTQALTDNPDAGKILAGLARKNNFTSLHRDRKIFYQYHPLFRDFLLETARVEFGEQKCRMIQQKAAKILEKGDDPEQSVGYFLQLEDWQGLQRVIKTIAQGVLEQGRNQTLLAWLDNLPDTVMENFPWLKYWQGMGLQFIDSQTALTALESAYWNFKASGDSSGAYLAWSDVIQTRAMAYGDYTASPAWRNEIQNLRHRFPEFESTIVEAQVTIAAYQTSARNDTDSQVTDKWEERLLGLLNTDLPLNLRFDIGINLLGKVANLGGDPGKALLAIDLLNPLLSHTGLSPAIICVWIAVEYFFSYWNIEKDEESLTKFDYALELTTVNEMQILKFYIFRGLIQFHLSNGHQELAGSLLNELAKRLNPKMGAMTTHYHLYCAWHACLEYNPEKAMQHAQIAQQQLVLDQASGSTTAAVFSQLALAHSYACQGQYGKALRHTARMRRTLPRQFNQKGIFLSWMANAQYALERKQPRRCHAFLRRALALGRELSFVRFPFFNPESVAQLYAEALQAGIEINYVQSLIRVRRLAAPDDSQKLDCWPWPLKIYCFGSLALVKDDAPVQFVRKAPKKPLQLLKALVALGGQKVTEQRLIDQLWPDEDGDKAHNVYSTTLNRLRKLIGSEYITLMEGSLSLDPRHCWIDVWNFQGLLKAAEDAKQNDDWQGFEQPAQNALNLYRDHFLAAEADASWMIAMRERLRHQYLKTTSTLADGWQARGDWKQALNCYQKGLDVENLSEEFYQGLMHCYQQLGLKAEALQSYQRCKRILSLSLGVEPSTQTQKLYHAIVNA